MTIEEQRKLQSEALRQSKQIESESMRASQKLAEESRGHQERLQREMIRAQEAFEEDRMLAEQSLLRQQKTDSAKEKLSAILLDSKDFTDSQLISKIKIVLATHDISINEIDCYKNLFSTSSLFAQAFMEQTLSLPAKRNAKDHWISALDSIFLKCRESKKLTDEMEFIVHWISEQEESSFWKIEILPDLKSQIKSLNRNIQNDKNIISNSEKQRSEDEKVENLRIKIEESFKNNAGELKLNGYIAQATLGAWCFCPNCDRLKRHTLNANERQEKISFSSAGAIFNRRCGACGFKWKHISSYLFLIITILAIGIYGICVPIMALFGK